LVSTVLITVGTIFFYEGRGFVFGDDSWSPGAWSYARVETYEQRLVANLAFVGFPVALCTLLLAIRLRTASRGLRIFAAVAPSL
ncbi:hypothetical protein, partial [Mesorhizobium sp. M1A.T.Ca.IN.004.03.1.1]|uniref:hypothetical protein n=1 Tax=Mesorhizobium sp. M1A.T.Ca.IN.004.03.1.1 TaxID=2496795 RepID=UPI0019D265D0